MKINIKKLLKKLILIAFISYVAITLMKQQKVFIFHKNSKTSILLEIDWLLKNC